MRPEFIVFIIALGLLTYKRFGGSWGLSAVGIKTSPSKALVWLSGFIILVALIWFGYGKYTNWQQIKDVAEKKKIERMQMEAKIPHSKQALFDPDDVLPRKIYPHKGLNEPILVKKGNWFWYQTIPASNPSVLIKYSLTKEGLEKADWVREDGNNVDLGDNINEHDLYIDFKLLSIESKPAIIKITLKRKG